MFAYVSHHVRVH